MNTTNDQTSRIALVRRPGPLLDQGLVSHIERQPVDLTLAMTQWEAYRAAMEGAGWQTVEVPSADDCPDAVFVEDTMVVFRNVAVISRPGADERKPEIIEAEKVVESLGLSINRIRPPGTLDGGDVLKIGDTVYVGLSTRTDEAAHHQLRALLAPTGRTVVSVPMDRALHLKTAVTALPDGTVIGWEPWLDDPSVFPEFLAVPEREGTAVVVLDPTTVLISASAPATADLLRARGLTVVTTPVTEFEKAEGCVTCLSVRIRS